MEVTDRLFGRHNIASPVLIALLHSHPVQRLKRIGQAGQPIRTDPRPYRYTRYDHCVGVMLLLKMLGAKEEEQIAGLLHDVSHTAFSHTIDFVLERGKAEDFQDSQHERYILSSGIPNILKKYQYDVRRIYDYHHFTLLEQDLPQLCADRVDYSLRESPLSLTRTCLPHLTTYQGRIVFTDQKAAYAFARQFLYLQETSWGGEEHVIREQIFAKALKHALNIGILTMNDFWKDDEVILRLLDGSEDPFIKKIFLLMKDNTFNGLLGTKKIQKKFRYVDPDILAGNKVITLSKVDCTYQNLIQEAKKRNEEGISLPDLAMI